MSTVDDKDNHKALLKMISKLMLQGKNCEIKANWDGKQWRFTTTVSGMLAEEFTPNGIEVREQARFVSRKTD